MSKTALSEAFKMSKCAQMKAYAMLDSEEKAAVRRMWKLEKRIITQQRRERRKNIFYIKNV